jgi:hypothetical protein
MDNGVTIVYLAYGARRLLDAAAFSALTFLHVAPSLGRPWRLAIYTDQPHIFRGYGIDAEYFPVEDVLDVESTYRYRSKLLTIAHAADAGPGDLVFVDGDTYFKRSPAALFASIGPCRSIMHELEWPLDAGARPDLAALVRSGTFALPALQAAQRRPGLAVWNSGVVGLAEANKALIPDVIAVTDELHARSDYHGVEQLAWAIVLSEAGEIVPARDVVYHYWFAQEELTYRTVAFLRRHRRLPTQELAARTFALGAAATADWKPPLGVRARVAARSVRRRLRAAVA